MHERSRLRPVHEEARLVVWNEDGADVCHELTFVSHLLSRALGTLCGCGEVVGIVSRHVELD
jgi:hypothetical protein